MGHWIKHPIQVLSGVYASLKSGGRFVAEFGGKGNVKRITDEIVEQLNKIGLNNSLERFPWYLPSVGQ